MKISPIIEVADLLKIHQNEDLVLVDVSNSPNAKANYETEHLQGALFVDVNTQLADIKTDLSIGGRHPLPTIERFAQTLSEIGISKSSHVIVYDSMNGANAAARLWWMLRAVGHESVQVLNGGFQAAKRNGFPLSSRIETPKSIQQPYACKAWQLMIAEMEEVEKVAKNKDYLVIDVRDSDRYNGITEPIDLVAGHIPGATNIPFTENLDATGRFLAPKELRAFYEHELNNVKSDQLIVHCGSGVTACHTLLALDYAGFEIPKLYVGSWSEWSRNDKEMATR